MFKWQRKKKTPQPKKERVPLRVRLAHFRKSVRKAYAQDAGQIGIAVIITVNFIFSIVSAQESPNPAPGEKPIGIVILESLFTAIFTVELLLNMFGHLGHLG